MSHTAKNWEADFRKVVETHEFDYDPQAWAAMEGLLDGAGAAAGTSNKAAGLAGAAWKWLFLLLVGAAGLLLWWFLPPERTAPPAVQTEAPAPPANPQNRPSVPNEQEALPPPTDVNASPRAKILPRQEQRTPIPLPTAPEEASSAPSPAEVIPNRFLEPLPVLPNGPIPALAPQDTSLPELNLKPPESTRPRRNRKTLYPDVIKKY